MRLEHFEPTTAIVRFLAKAGIDKYKERRRNAILRALDNGLLKIGSHQMESDEFISAYLATEHALMKASSQHKFNFLLNLFIDGSNSGRVNREPDAYQEVLSIIDELSERELNLLYHLYNYERDHGDTEAQDRKQNNLQVNYLMTKTSLERELVIALLVRLRRTGLLLTRGERNTSFDLATTAIETFFISPIASEIKAWIFNAYEAPSVTSS